MVIISAAESLQMGVLDVGQGDCTIFVLPGGKQAILIDCPKFRERVAFDVLMQHGVQEIPLVVITHSDMDHSGGVGKVLREFIANGGRVGAISFIIDQFKFPDPDPNKRREFEVVVKDIHRLALQHGARVSHPFPNDDQPREWFFGDVKVECIHPTYQESVGWQTSRQRNARNNGSVVLKITYQHQRVLMGADVQGPGWVQMADRGVDLRAEVFKFPHHGAWSSSGLPLQQLMDSVRPQCVVISVGTNQPLHYQHPSTITLETLQLFGPRTVICTQATARCSSRVLALREEALALLPASSRAGHSGQDTASCPCGGTVWLGISGEGVMVSPTKSVHDSVVDLMDSARCRLKSFLAQ